MLVESFLFFWNQFSWSLSKKIHGKSPLQRLVQEPLPPSVPEDATTTSSRSASGRHLCFKKNEDDPNFPWNLFLCDTPRNGFKKTVGDFTFFWSNFCLIFFNASDSTCLDSQTGMLWWPLDNPPGSAVGPDLPTHLFGSNSSSFLMCLKKKKKTIQTPSKKNGFMCVSYQSTYQPVLGAAVSGVAHSHGCPFPTSCICWKKRSKAWLQRAKRLLRSSALTLQNHQNVITKMSWKHNIMSKISSQFIS